VNDPDSHSKSQANSEQSPEVKAEGNAWMKFAGLGMELAGSSLGLAAIGYFVDRYRDKDDGYGVAAGLLVGFSFGMFRVIQKAMNEVRSQTK
jgi:F0F1-type ATP synthase assembly protein I